MPKVQDSDTDDDVRDRVIVFLRHGIAVEPGEVPDDERGLTAEGHARMRVAAKGLEIAFPRAQAIWSSPLLRAMQTALWVSKAYRSRVKVQTTGVLRPDAPAREFERFLTEIDERRIIVVGHEPNLIANVFALTGFDGDTSALALKKGGCIGVRQSAREPIGRIEWLLPPRVLRRLARD